MGMYTEIYVNVDLKQDLPDDVLYILKGLVRNVTCTGNYDNDKEFRHETVDAFEDEKWKKLTENFGSRFGYLFYNMSYYTPYTTVARLNYDFVSDSWSLIGKGDIKNYDGEIEQFFEWIAPYVTTDFMGYSRYEEHREPTLFFSDHYGEEEYDNTHQG